MNPGRWLVQEDGNVTERLLKLAESYDNIARCLQ